MIIEGSRRDCAKEMMVLAAALTIQDPRERPAEVRGTADEMHARFTEINLIFRRSCCCGSTLMSARLSFPLRICEKCATASLLTFAYS